MAKIPSAYFREQKKYYDFDSFKSELGIEDNTLVEQIIERLKYRKIIKPTTKNKFNNAAVDEDFEDEINELKITPGSSNGFVFDFVGVAYTKNCILKCYPKYIVEECSQDDFDKKYKEHFKTVLKVIQKYNDEKKQRAKIFNGEEKKENFNRLSVMLYILNDYYENGVYSNQKNIIETNGEGEIDWDKTINETFPFIKNNQPYYFELQTIRTVNDDEDFIKLVHECIVSDCSRELRDAGILDTFGLNGDEITSLTLNDLGNDEYIVYKLENELKTQYIDKKRSLLKNLLLYVKRSENGLDETDFSFYGVHKFAPVWEAACKVIFDDVKDKTVTKLDSLGLINFTNQNIKINDELKEKTLMQLIEKAKWNFGPGAITRSDPLKPDTISIRDNTFYIMDAKYYLVTENDNGDISGQPGIESIVKQFAYHKAYYDFLQFSDLRKVSNSFLIPRLMPSELPDDKAENRGHVEFNLMQSYTLDTLCPISVVELAAQFVFDKYLSGSKASEILTSENFGSQDIIKNTSGITSNFNWANDYIPNLDYTMLGFMRKNYMDALLSSGNKEFYFFFWRHKNNVFYPVHNLLPCCNHFLGYCLNGGNAKKLVKGTIVDEGNGIIQTVTKDELKNKMSSAGFEGVSHYSADSYYCVKVKDVEILEGKTKSDYENEIKEFEGNDVLSETSPKVLNIQWE